MPYSIDIIQKTLARDFGLEVKKPALRAALDTPVWVPEVDRMIAVSDVMADLPNSDRYGLFIGMDGAQYQISTGNFRYARLLTPEEIAKCY